MRQIMIHGVLMAALAVCPMTAVADTVFHLDTPQDGATVFGLVEVSGYIVDDGQQCGPPPEWQACDWGPSLVSKVELFVDNSFVAEADLGQPRWDVLQAFPWYAGTPYERPGFSVSFNADHFQSGERSLFVRVTFSDMTTMDYGQRTVIVEPGRNQAPFGELEYPGANQPMNRVFPVTGWALDDSSVAKIEVLIDGEIRGEANSGVSRPDISSRFPSNSNAGEAGFYFNLNTAKLVNGVHTLAIRLTDDEGAVRVIGHRFVHVFNSDSNLAPFGEVEWPPANHIMYADVCNTPGGWSSPPFEEPQIVEWVAGWALDIGMGANQGGVAYVQLLIDNEVKIDTIGQQSAFYFTWLEHLTELVNTYGLLRLDILDRFVDVPYSKDSGFFFVLDMGQLLNDTPEGGYNEGLHMITIRAGDWDNNVADIASIPVIFDCNNDTDRPSWGDIYTPTHMQRVDDVVFLSGWAIDLDYVVDVEIFIDGVSVGFVDEARVHLPSPEIEFIYPWLPDWHTEEARWEFDLDTVALNIADGEHVLVVVTHDYWGSSTHIAERRFVVDNLKKKATLLND